LKKEVTDPWIHLSPGSKWTESCFGGLSPHLSWIESTTTDNKRGIEMTHPIEMMVVFWKKISMRKQIPFLVLDYFLEVPYTSESNT
jgi:hypothetical protein